MAKAKVKRKRAPILAGYELIGRIGKGGMGNVFKARQISMDRIVALKILPSNLAKDKKFVERFHREARAAAKLSHMNIIQSIDVGEADGYHYFAMEYVQGPTVEDLLEKSPVLKEDFSLHIVVQIARAIQAAEKLHMVHLDIKPSNIMITRDRVAKLADFGVARHVAEMDSKTKETLVFGTPEYMSPEQALGKADLDSRSDIYSLGVTFYQMVTGKLPFEGATARETVDMRLKKDPIPPKQLNPNLSDETCAIIEKMLKRDRNERYQNATELIEDLEYVINLHKASPSAIASQPIEIPPEELYSVSHLDFRRRRANPVGVIVGLLTILLAVGAVFYVVAYRPDLVDKIQIALGIKEVPQEVSPQVSQPVEPVVPTPEPPPAPSPPKRLLGAGTTATGAAAPTERRRSHPVAKRSYAEVKEMIRQPIAAGDFMEAIRIIDTFPLGYRQYPEWEELCKLKEELKKKMQERFEEDKKLVEQLISAGKFDEAMALCEDAKKRYPEEMRKEIEQKQLQIQALKEREEQRQSAMRMAALQTFRDAADGVFTAVRVGNFDAAAKMLQQLAEDPTYALVRPIIQRLAADMTLLRDFVGAVNSSLQRSIGKEITLGGVRMALKGFEKGDMILLAAGKEIRKNLLELKPAELIAFAESGGYLKSHKLGELHLACALFYFFNKSIENAVLQLKAARDAGVDVQPYIELIEGG